MNSVETSALAVRPSPSESGLPLTYTRSLTAVAVWAGEIAGTSGSRWSRPYQTIPGQMSSDYLKIGGRSYANSAPKNQPA